MANAIHEKTVLIDYFDAEGFPRLSMIHVVGYDDGTWVSKIPSLIESIERISDNQSFIKFHDPSRFVDDSEEGVIKKAKDWVLANNSRATFRDHPDQ